MLRSMRVKATTVVLAVGLAGIFQPVLGTSAHPSRLEVHSDQSIQAAIDAAHPGDTIEVDPGTYRENVVIRKDDLTLEGAGPSKSVLAPPSTPALVCQAESGDVNNGICVANMDQNGTTISVVKNVHVTGFTVRDFPGIGILLQAVSGALVDHNVAANDTDYGITAFSSSYIRFLSNTTFGSSIGVYVGVSPQAHVVVRDNVSYDNLAGDGIVVRDSTDGIISHNDLHDNCTGLTFVNTDPSMPVARWEASDNTVRHNNLFCPVGDLGPPFSPVAGNGIAIAGGQHIVLTHNTVGDNQGSTYLSGGIVLASTAGNGGSDASNNTVVGNRLENNQPADLINRATGPGNRFLNNQCDTSIPPGLCRAGGDDGED